MKRTRSKLQELLQETRDPALRTHIQAVIEALDEERDTVKRGRPKSRDDKELIGIWEASRSRG
jgi:hypothetical protein